MGRSSYWHEPEQLPGQAERDTDPMLRKFYVYVLYTQYGHYTCRISYN